MVTSVLREAVIHTDGRSDSYKRRGKNPHKTQSNIYLPMTALYDFQVSIDSLGHALRITTVL